MRLSDERLRQVLAWLVIGLLAVPVGGALWLGVAHGESPCILCWAQRTSMMLMALVALFVIRYGPRPRYLGMLVLLGTWGVFMSLRHSALHLARDIGQGFAGDILGAHTYVWAWAVHWLVLGVAGVLMLVVREPLAAKRLEPGRAGRFAMGLLVVLAGANAVQAFASSGPPPYIGQGDPVRLSLDPRRWVWSLAEAEGAVSLRGLWTVPAPDPAGVDVDRDPADGPLAGLPVLAVQRRERVTASLDGALTGLATWTGTGPGNDRPERAMGPVADLDESGPGAMEPDAASEGLVLAVTDRFGVYLLDAGLSRVLHRVVLDPAFSIDLSPLAGTTFLGPDTAVVLSTNKSYVLLQPDSAADAGREWRHFLETDGAVAELSRSRFATVRARQMYVLSLAYDPAADELITIAVPSPRHRRLVVSRFERSDLVLSSEFVPGLGPGLRVRGPERSTAEYVVTGAAVADGILYAISTAYSTLLAIDLASETITAAYAVPGLDRPVGLGVRGGELWVAQADGGVAVLERPAADPASE